jgi:hypothetical protein
VYITVKCEVCRAAIALELRVFLSGVYTVSINPIIESICRLKITTPTLDNYIYVCVCVCVRLRTFYWLLLYLY